MTGFWKGLAVVIALVIVCYLHSVKFGFGLERNFALLDGGALVVNHHTSLTRGAQPPNVWIGMYRALWEEIRGYDLATIEINPPTVALEESVGVGKCWMFDGRSGSLGISLTDDVLITHLAINNAWPALISNAAVKAAPRHMVLWGLVDDARVRHLSATTGHRLTTDAQFPSTPRPTSKPPSHFLEIAEFSFDIYARPLLQVFTVHQSFRELNIPIRTVVLEVLSNWGSNVTCLYNVAVHGQVAV